MAKYNKIIYYGETLIDLTGDTVKPENLLKGNTAHAADGEYITGTCTFDSDTQDATASASEILSTKTAYVKGEKKTGTMPNHGGVSGSINTKDGTYTVPSGYHDGSGKVGIDSTEKSKLISQNIREGITILGVEGSMSGNEDSTPQEKSVTPSKVDQTILPDEGYNCLSQVIVLAVPFKVTDNSAGGQTVTIGA